MEMVVMLAEISLPPASCGAVSVDIEAFGPLGVGLGDIGGFKSS